MSNLPRIIVDVVLFCPHCGVRHIDEARNGEKWHRRAHTTHRCQACLRDFDVYASGQAPDTDSPVAAAAAAASQAIVDTTRARNISEWFIDALRVIQLTAFENTNSDPNFTIAVSKEFGLRIGLSPGESVTYAGPCGGIHIKSEAAK